MKGIETKVIALFMQHFIKEVILNMVWLTVIEIMKAIYFSPYIKPEGLTKQLCRSKYMRLTGKESCTITNFVLMCFN